MKAKTVKTENGWSYSFRKRNDGTIVIIQKNLERERYSEIHIFGKEVLEAFKEVCS